MWSISAAHTMWGAGWQLVHTRDGISTAVAMFIGPDAEQTAERCRDLLTTFGLIPTELPEGLET